MTIERSTARDSYAGDGGVAVAFTFNFKAYDTSHVRVIKKSGGVDTVVDPSAYTVSGIGTSSGVVNLPGGVALGDTLTIKRLRPSPAVDTIFQGGSHESNF